MNLWAIGVVVVGLAWLGGALGLVAWAVLEETRFRRSEERAASEEAERHLRNLRLGTPEQG